MKIKTYGVLQPFTLLILIIFIPFLIQNCGQQNPRSRDRNYDEDGWIGIYVQDIDNELRNYLDLDERYGVLINDIVEGSPADDAGLRGEDVIVKFDRKRIRRTSDLTRAVKRKNPGDQVEVEVVRNKRKKTFKIEIERKSGSYYSDDFDAKSKRSKTFSFRVNSRPWLGVRLAELNENLAEYFEVDEREGVLILSVEEDSPADYAGLKAGDVILEIEGRRMRDGEDVQDIISNRETGDDIEIKFKRKGENESVRVELEGRAGSYYFDEGKVREWEDELKGWGENFHRDKLRNLRHKIRFDVERRLERKMARLDRQIIDLTDVEDEINAAMEQVGERLEREMEQLNDNLNQLKIEIKIHDF